ncbi:hypothetical protein MMC19_000778 [Ptychographa xylographoides]|nr:hypothetical protein [Ptychographa xylographoides]
MNILITGAGGFVGQALAAALLNDDTVSRLTLTDTFEPSLPSTKSQSTVQTRCVKADLTSKEACQSLFHPDLSVIYLLHGLMSGASEANLDLGLKVNVDSMRLILDILRTVAPGVKVVFASSCGVYGPAKKGEVFTENTLPLPGSSYGAQKFMTEVLLDDYARRNLLDARILRLPTIIVRPGKPTGAASSFCSGIIREPLKRERSVLPVDPDFELWCCSTRTVIRNLVHAKEISKVQFEGKSRRVCLPGVVVTSAEMLEALRKVAGDEIRALVEEKRDPVIEKIVYSWAPRFDTSLATRLGFQEDGTLEQTLKKYIEDYGEKSQS